MKKETKEKIWQMKLDYPLCHDGVKTYIEAPTDFILRKRLHLDDSQVDIVRMAYAQYQDTVREVLVQNIERVRSSRARAERNKI